MSMLGKTLHKFTEATKGNLDDIMVNAAFTLLTSITLKSPVMTGMYRGAWISTSSKPSASIPTSIRRSPTVINEAVAKMQVAVTRGTTWYVTNNMPQARSIEYGLYVKNPKKGTWIKGNKGSKGHYEIRSINGFSKRARAGVARISVRKMMQDLNKDIIKHKIRGKI